MSPLRSDLAAIAEWIPPGASVLDLGCGDGQLLSHLRQSRQVKGYGLEIDTANVAACVSAGINVIQADLDDGLMDFDSGSFDYVLLTQTLQALQRPDQMLSEMLRVGRHAIVTFPNFGHWRVRLQLMFGKMPVTSDLPNRWFDTPNIHLCTVRDFEELCQLQDWQVEKRSLLDRSHHDHARIRYWPNVFSELALYQLQAPNAQ
ncbi:MAG: methionine biosynthesis protein MetW [Panacagrimonas sp.]